MRLKFSCVVKNKHLKNHLVVSFETPMQRASNYVNYQNLEDFHEFVRAYTCIFTNKIYEMKDFTYRNLINIIKNAKLVALSGSQDSCVLITRQDDYIYKLHKMIDDGIRQGIYSSTIDTTLSRNSDKRGNQMEQTKHAIRKIELLRACE